MLDNSLFVYDRNYPPLFFHGNNYPPTRFTEKAYRCVSREFHHKLKTDQRREACPWSVLSNGMTMGEFAMYYLTQKNQQRKANNY